MRTILVEIVITFALSLLLVFGLAYALTLPDHVCDPRIAACE